jgi:hypothetical protein
MHKVKHWLWLIAIVFPILILNSIPSHAIAATSITITGGQDITGDCGQNFALEGLYFVVNMGLLQGETNDDSGRDYFIIVIFDSTGNAVAVEHNFQFVGDIYDAIGWYVSMNTGVPTTSSPSSRSVKAVLIDTPYLTQDADIATYIHNTPVASSAWFDMGGFSPACAALPGGIPNSASDDGITMPPDNRINWQFGDSNVGILYPGRDGAVNLYIYASQEYIFDFVTPEEIEPYQDNPPSENTLLKRVENISVYILSTGQIQFNFGPDAEGKVWVLILNDLSDRDTSQSYYIDPKE